MHSRAEGGWAVRRLGGWLSVAGPFFLTMLIGLAVWPPDATHVINQTFSHGPSPIERDSLAAVAATGVTVRWRGAVQPVAVELDGDAIGTSVRAAVATTVGTQVTIGDALGPLDSATVAAGGATFRFDGVGAGMAIRAAGEDLRLAPQRPTARSLAVFAPAGWESRFLLEAIEAAGGRVVARIRVGPRTFVTQGQPLPLDTATHGVAVVLGSLDPETAGQVRRFVRGGGGLVISPGGSGLDDLVPGRFGRLFRPPASLSLPAAREDLVTRPIGRVSVSATILETAGAGARTLVQRVGPGRVVQLADEDTWRLALASDAGRTAHERLWLTAIALASPRDVARPATGDNPAPRAALVAAS